MNEMICSLRQGKTIRELAHGAEDYLTFEEGMRCQVLRTQSGDYVVQARDRHGEITRWAGVNRSISVRFTPAPQGRVRVTIEQGKQGNKTAALGIGLFLLWGAALTALWGLLRQRLLVRGTERFIRQWAEAYEGFLFPR